jgi:predicted RNA-binding Zn ribbon-like protein
MLVKEWLWIYSAKMADRQTATGDIGAVQEFVNTLDALEGRDRIKGPNTLQAWLVANHLLEEGRPVDEADVRHAIALREAMRAVIGANSGQTVYPVDTATLNEAATASRLRMRFTADGRPRLEPEIAGVVGAMGRLVAKLYVAMQDEGWAQLKLCGSQECRWAFFDRSRNHSSRWCTMASCGNREKARRFRTQHKTHS